MRGSSSAESQRLESTLKVLEMQLCSRLVERVHSQNAQTAG